MQLRKKIDAIRERIRQFQPGRKLRIALIKASIGVALLAIVAGLFGYSTWHDEPADPALNRDDKRLRAFRIGPASKYRQPGVYDDFVDSHGIYLVSAHDMLVALSARSTEADVRVRFDDVSGLFRCPSSGALYTSDGLAWADSPASRSLDRCRIRALGLIDDPDVEMLVDPQRRFSFEKNQWSMVMSNHQFVE